MRTVSVAVRIIQPSALYLQHNPRAWIRGEHCQSCIPHTTTERPSCCRVPLRRETCICSLRDLPYQCDPHPLPSNSIQTFARLTSGTTPRPFLVHLQSLSSQQRRRHRPRCRCCTWLYISLHRPSLYRRRACAVCGKRNLPPPWSPF